MTRKRVLERDSRESMCVYASVKDETRVSMNVREFCDRAECANSPSLREMRLKIYTRIEGNYIETFVTCE